MPDGGPANVRALATTCGMATFGVDAAQRRLGELRIAASGNIYVRSIRLTYGNVAGGTAQQHQISLHRLLGNGELSEPFATTKAGLGLVAVAVDVNPPGYGADPVMLALTGPDGIGGGAGDADDRQAHGVATVATLAGRDWVLVGSTLAQVQQLRDIIQVGRGKGRFDSLVISSRGNDLPVQSVTVVPVNGAAYTVDVRSVIAPGTLSRVIAIDPPDFLHEVSVTYGTMAPQSRVPMLEIRGHYSENWLGKIGDNRQYAGGWVMLGTVDVIASPHTAMPRDRFRIAGQEGPFKKLRFVARRGAVDLSSVSIDAGDGREETVPINTVLLPGVQTVPFALSNGGMAIGTIALSPRLHSSSRIDASVEVWAQY